MKTFALTILSLAAFGCFHASEAATASAVTQPKDYVATPLVDGSIELVVMGKALLPSGGQVAIIDLRAKLEAAAARECHGKFDLTVDKSAPLGVAPNGKGFIAKQRGVARCKAPAD